jgi:hypothetical protein
MASFLLFNNKLALTRKASICVPVVGTFCDAHCAFRRIGRSGGKLLRAVEYLISNLQPQRELFLSRCFS